MARKRFTVHSRSLRSFLFDGWLVKLIMKGFGWHYQGDEIEEESLDIAETQFYETYATTTVRTETKRRKYLEFHSSFAHPGGIRAPVAQSFQYRRKLREALRANGYTDALDE